MAAQRYVRVCVYLHVLAETREEGTGILDPLKLELQVHVNFMRWC